LTGLFKDNVSAQYQMESGYEFAKSRVQRAIDGIDLNGGLATIMGSNTAEQFAQIHAAYMTGATTEDQKANAMLFLRRLIQAQALNANGTINTSHEFANVDDMSQSNPAFPSDWVDPDPTDNEFYEVRFNFDPLVPVELTNPARFIFEYEYRYEVRAYGQEKFTQVGSENSGVISLTVEGAPFSRWAIFRDQTTNQNNSNLHFVGGATPEVFYGRVHTNQRPYFYGAPIFMELFTSAQSYSNWFFGSNASAGYSGSPDFRASPVAYQASVASIPMAATIFNTTRLAAGDPSPDAAFNNTSPTNADLVNFVRQYAGGTLGGSVTSVPNGVYIPVNNQTDLNPTGGIFVQGNAAITLDVVQGSSDFSASQWSKLSASHQGCKFQKIRVDHGTSGVATRDIYVGDDPCEVTYFFNADSSSSTPVVVNGRVGGNVHATGEITSLGGASRTRPAIAQDFAFTISAVRDIQITNDLQYEDVEYVELDSSLEPTSNIVADAFGSKNGSSYLPTSQNIAPVMDPESKTVLGLISTHRNVIVDTGVPADPNIHAAIYAGNSSAFNSTTGLGCGANTSGQRGCGFGYEGWETQTGKGVLKLYGSISEYKNQTVGIASSPPKGFKKRYSFDPRLAQSVVPPGFPISSDAIIRTSVQPIKTWRLSSNAANE
jgi:hypothetical protein